MTAYSLRRTSVVFLAAAIALAGCSILRPTRSGELPSHAPYMIVTTAVGGEVLDCGCKTGPKGGLARRKALIDTLSAMDGEPLVLDAGDFLGPATRPAFRERAPLVAEAMGAMGYDLATFGENDLSYGWPFLRSLAARHGIRFVCANVFDAQTGELLAAPYAVRKMGEFRVAFFGVLSPDLAITPLAGDAPVPEVRDPIAIARELVPRLRREADLVVGLLHMHSTKAKEFTQQVAGMDLVIFGHDPARRPALEVVEETPTPSVRVGSRGRYVGLVRIAGDTGGAARFTGELLALDASVPEDPVLAAMVAEREAAMQAR